jgi:hypothetical protein
MGGGARNLASLASATKEDGMKLFPTTLVVNVILVCFGLVALMQLPANAASNASGRSSPKPAHPTCRKGETWDAKAGACKSKCTGGFVWDGTRCSCPPGTTLVFQPLPHGVRPGKATCVPNAGDVPGYLGEDLGEDPDDIDR